MPDFTLETSYGLLSITDTGLKNSAPALLLIHGNSSSSKVFRSFFTSPLATQYRIVAFDLPGHGASSNAPSPQTTYTMSGYAACAVHVLEHLNIESVVVIGWSLGGHVAICMVPELKRASERGCKRCEMKGMVLTGTPPALGAEQCGRGFKIPTSPKKADGAGNADAAKQGKNSPQTDCSEDEAPNTMAALHWTPELAEQIARGSAPNGRPHLYEPWMLADAIRTDGRARSIMFTAFVNGHEPNGQPGVDQVAVIETEDIPIAVINGAEEPFVDVGYLDRLKWKRLWRGECVKIDGLGHAPFWEDWGAYEKVLGEFLKDVSSGEA